MESSAVAIVCARRLNQDLYLNNTARAHMRHFVHTACPGPVGPVVLGCPGPGAPAPADKGTASCSLRVVWLRRDFAVSTLRHLCYVISVVFARARRAAVAAVSYPNGCAARPTQKRRRCLFHCGRAAKRVKPVGERARIKQCSTAYLLRQGLRDGSFCCKSSPRIHFHPTTPPPASPRSPINYECRFIEDHNTGRCTTCGELVCSQA